MNKNVKLLLMFTPLVLFLVALAVVVQDLRHPSITVDHCEVTATGAEVVAFKNKGPYIYRQSENQLQDVSLHCHQLGHLLLNDLQLMHTSIRRGQEAEVQHKRFQLLPDRWMVSVHTGLEQK